MARVVLLPRAGHGGRARWQRARRGGAAAGAPGPRLAADALVQSAAAALRAAPPAQETLRQEHQIRPLGTSGCEEGFRWVWFDSVHRFSQFTTAIRHGDCSETAVSADVGLAARRGVPGVAGAAAGLQPALALQARRVRRRTTPLSRISQGQQKNAPLSHSVLINKIFILLVDFLTFSFPDCYVFSKVEVQ